MDAHPAAPARQLSGPPYAPVAKTVDVVALYDLVLMREPEPGVSRAAEARQDPVTALCAALGSAEFRSRVLEPLLEGDPEIQAALRRPLSSATKTWAAAALELDGFAADALVGATSRAAALARVVSDLTAPSRATASAPADDSTGDWRSTTFQRALADASNDAGTAGPPVDVSAMYSLFLARAPEHDLPAQTHLNVPARLAAKLVLGSPEFEARFLRPLLKGPSYAPPDLRRAVEGPTRLWASTIGEDQDGEDAILQAETRAGMLLAVIDQLADPVSGSTARKLWRSPPVRDALREVANAPVALQRDYELLDGPGVFDRAYYLAHNPDVAQSGAEPLWHFLTHGVREGRNPSPSFDLARWCKQNPDVDTAKVNPFAYSLRFGSAEDLAARDLNCPFGPGGLPPAIPLRFTLDRHLAHHPTINLLLPAARMATMSGGPNTALNVAFRMALEGFAVRVISTDLPPDDDLRPLTAHIRNIAECEATPAVFEIVDGSNRTSGVRIGANDVFFATAWWTAQMARWGSPLVGSKPIIYLIQDYEPILHPASSQYALAKETYGFDHIPLINTSLLAQYLTENKIGRFADAEHAGGAIVFEPTIDKKKFHNQARRGRKRQLLFYARPRNGIRNLFEMGLAALRRSIEEGVLDPEAWDFVGMGEDFAPISLPRGATLRCAPWLGIDGYARQMREADILLSLMLSPHPSYPPLEMAGCGGLVVTNSYENKTAERLAEISANIVTAEPSVDAIVEGLRRATTMLPDLGRRQAASELSLPRSWDESFQDAIPALTARLAEIGLTPDAGSRPPHGEPRELELPKAADDSYLSFLERRADARAGQAYAPLEAGLLSFVSTVWNTPPAFLDVLARSVDAQEGGTQFEWLVLDNGSTRTDTRDYLADLATRPYVRLQRVEKNLGIIGGMRYVLKEARGRYIIPLDSDDYLYPDCVQTLTWHIQRAKYPPLLYTDEDKLLGESLLGAYLKPDFDPVLFSNSCYIAHLCAIDRKMALELGAYSDPAPEGSHDWDTFTRFFNAGHMPVHVAEVLYSWRMHSQSTAANIDSKPIVYESQLAVLRRYVSGRPFGEHLSIEKSPLFGATPDWWLRRRRDIQIRPVTSLLVRSTVDRGATPDLKIAPGLDHKTIEIAEGSRAMAILPHVRRCAEEGRLVHVVASEITVDDDEWIWEAAGLLESYPEAVAVGGRLHTYGEILDAGRFMGFGEDGFGCPDRGRLLGDPGYFAQMWKPHSVDAVSALHAVFDPDFLLSVLQDHVGAAPSIHHLGCWVGAAAAARGRRVIYSPFVSAESRIDWGALVPSAEKARLLGAYGGLARVSPLRSPHLGSTAGDAYVPAFNPKPVPEICDPPAVSQTGRRAEARVGFSLLTTLHIGSDAELFRLTVESVMAQSHRNFEWIVLSHGPISPALLRELRRLRLNLRVRLFSLPENLGIVGGMRYALERARKEYVVPLDGDDLLTPHALALLSHAITTETDSRPVFLYTDEDILIENEIRSPYRRPDWDPVLDLENSWIWHLVAFSRQKALDKGVYTDRGVEFCHDWDTARRLAYLEAGAIHVPGIAYHWRHHLRSTSNSGTENSGSAQSSRHLLTRTLQERDMAEHYEVRVHPIARGATEWWLAPRHPADPPPLFHLSPTPELWRDMKAWIEPFGEQPFVVLQAEETSALEETAVAEARKFFDLIPDLAVLGGRIESAGVGVSAGLWRTPVGTLQGAYEGLRTNDFGAYALASKPQTVIAPIPDLLAVRPSFLRDALSLRPDPLLPSELGVWLGALAQARGLRAAYSPLIRAQSNRAGGWWRYDALYTPQTWRACLERAVGGEHARG